MHISTIVAILEAMNRTREQHIQEAYRAKNKYKLTRNI